jgi:TRAP-type mannitol/chloroaromatic compound transport system permease large subunit
MSALGPTTGMWMLVVLGVLIISTGLPVWTLLIGVSSAFALLGLASGVMDLNVLSAMPQRLVGLLEGDLLQALPLYVFVGILLQRLAVATSMYWGLVHVLNPLGAGHAMAGLGLGALIAPMNGSVASSSSLLARLVAPRLGYMEPARATALISVAATTGVVIPPSLVLILLGDAMMRAHTEAANLPGSLLGKQQIINTQDVFHAALLPGLAILLAWALVVRWQNRHVHPEHTRLSARQAGVALVAGLSIVVLLAGVFTGKLFAVEAAATGCMLLVVGTLVMRALDWSGWKEVMAHTLSLSGALMALLVGATVFSLVFRLFGTDRWLSALLLSSPMPPLVTAAAVLLVVALCAWVLDAFEMIFVVIPIIAPPLVGMLGDAQQAAVLLLLVLQLSFLVPPMGYAVMMARTHSQRPVTMRALLRALAPFIAVQVAVVMLVFAAPWVVHRLDATVVVEARESEEDITRQMEQMVVPLESSPEPAVPNKP